MGAMSVRTQLAYLAAALTIVVGLLALLNPLLAIRLVGLDVVEPRGLSEVRATYGALFVLMGAVMLWAIPTRPRSSIWLRFAGLLWSAKALGRVLSVAIDGVITPFNLLALAIEILIGAATLVASFQTPRPRARQKSAAALPDDDEPDPLKAYRG